jgi:hypothetical protein
VQAAIAPAEASRENLSNLAASRAGTAAALAAGMKDIYMLLWTGGFFVVAILYVRGLERL